jgi:hypothetical protein
VEGPLTGSREGLDRDGVVCPWHFKKGGFGLQFFAAPGVIEWSQTSAWTELRA